MKFEEPKHQNVLKVLYFEYLEHEMYVTKLSKLVSVSTIVKVVMSKDF